MLIFGTRPEAIKMAPLVHALRQDEMLNIKVCTTAQHREMLDQVLAAFEIYPDFDLNLMAQGQDLFDVTAQVLVSLRSLLKETKPKLVLVHGDTTTSMAAGIACFYLGIPIGHIEAGLRTYDLAAPFPEEFNRRVTGLVAALHFAPTSKSKQNLINEGIDKNCILKTGNTVVDALKWALRRLETDIELGSAVDNQLDDFLPFDWKQEKFVLITGHRRENFGDGFKETSRRFPCTLRGTPYCLSGQCLCHLATTICYQRHIRLLHKNTRLWRSICASLWDHRFQNNRTISKNTFWILQCSIRQ